MKIAISGVGGFIGSNLKRYLESNGHAVININRNVLELCSAKWISTLIEGCDVVINLSGASISRRWTNDVKREILHSRVNATHSLVSAVNLTKIKPKLFISTSAIGIYASEGCHNEESKHYADTFMSEVCGEWEHEATKLNDNVRLIITRLGVVVSDRGGMLKKIIDGVKYGVVPIVGNGMQHFNWISIDDLMRVYDFLIVNESISGVVNVIAPTCLNNGQLMEIVGVKYNISLKININEWVFKTVLGEVAHFVIGGQCVYPKVLIDSGFVFEDLDIDKLI